MTSFTFDDGIPAANNNPSNDQPKMLQNNISTKALLAVDHVTFDSIGSGGAGASGGQHLKVTYNSKFAPGAMTDPISIGYTKNGVASPFAELYFKNQNGDFPVSLLKAWAIFAGGSGAIIATQSNNINTIVRNSAGNYTITLVANAVTTADFGVLISSTLSGLFAIVSNYTITGIGTFTIKCFDLNGNAKDPTSITFSVYQI